MIRTFRFLPALVLVSAAMLGCATGPSPNTGAPAQLTEGVLTDAKRMTLYTFDRDVPGAGKSACNGNCARDWLPFFAPAGARPGAGYQIITRDDGKAQWAFQGKPLYYWPEDLEPGDKFGDGYNKLWRVVGANGPVTVSPATDSDGY